MGAALVAIGAVDGHSEPFRTGVGILLIGLAGLVMHYQRCNTQRIMRHQAELARVTKAQRQEWSMYGYRAGELDTLGRLGLAAREAQILHLPDRPHRHRNGA